ncbi:MAG: ubiquinone/menaquinone biosynthesis methyltransferase [Thermoplasmata archaeon]
MAERGGAAPDRRAPDGSPYPARGAPTFERDVRRMFTHIARGYDGFDHLASLGNDFLWRPRALWDLDRFRGPSAPPVRRALDIGCGTGDLAVLVARHFPDATVVASDFTAAMLARLRRRHARSPALGRISLSRANGLALPFADGIFDLVTNAFVLRNFADLPRAFREMRRVLRPGGTLACLEITDPGSRWVRELFHAYFDRVVPWMGKAAGSEGPYRYLPESLRSLPPPSALCDAMRAAGFPRAEARPQSAGIVTTFLGEAGDVPPGARG